MHAPRFYLSLLTIATACLFASTASFAQPQFYTILRSVPAATFGERSQVVPVRIDRPAPGTYVPQVVVIKTRQAVSIQKGDRTLANGTLQNTLGWTRPQDVRHAVFAEAPRKFDQLAVNYGLDRIYEVRYDEPIEPFDLCMRIMQDPSVEYAVPKRIHQLTYTPNDPRFNQQAGVRALGIQQAWDISKGSKSVIVAIIDSGTDFEHEDLASQIFTNSKEIPGNGLDDDGNGFIDDVRGWDFVGNVTVNEIQQGRFKPDNDVKVRSTTMTDGLAHGTTTAGCAGARADNATGIAGTGFDITILPIKVGSDNRQVNGIFNGYTAIRYAADLGAHIINCSWGGRGNDPQSDDVIAYATAKGALVVAATGNDGLDMDITPFFPACSPGAFSIGSISNDFRASSFSNYGTKAAIYAPGEDVFTTYPNNLYRGQTGTSFSAPLVSGVAALLKALHPDWTPQQIALQLRATATPIQGISGELRAKYFGAMSPEIALQVNRSFSSGDRMPGFVVDRMATASGSSITSTSTTQVTLTIKNILAPASGGLVTVRSLDPRCAVRTLGNLTFGAVATNATTTLQFEIDPDDNYPWYSNDIPLEISIRSGDFFNIEFHTIQFSTPSANMHEGGSVPGYTWLQVASAGPADYWASGLNTTRGNEPLVFRFGSNQGGAALPLLPTALAARAGGRAWIAGSTANGSGVIYTTDGGNSWRQTATAQFAGSIGAIHMYSDAEGIALGDAIGIRLGFLKTTNGGQQWSALAQAPQVSGMAERVVPGAFATVGDTLWCLTTAGRITRTPNRGSTWSSAGVNAGAITPLGIGFSTARMGVVVFSPPGTNTTFRAAATTDGGTTWTVVQRDIDFGSAPVSVVSRPGHVAVVCADGAVFGTDDGAQTWTSILSRPSDNVRSCVAVPVADQNTLVMVGDGLYTLNYRFTSRTGPKSLEFVSQGINFGNVNAGASRTRAAGIRNTGSGVATIQSAVVIPGPNTPDTAFRVSSDPFIEIEGESSASISVRFSTNAPGEHTAILRVTSDATPATIELSLIATQLTTGVNEERSAAVQLYPIPTAGEVVVELPDGNTYTLTVLEATGREVWRHLVTGPRASLSLPLSSGSYVATISGSNVLRVIPLVVLR